MLRPLQKYKFRSLMLAGAGALLLSACAHPETDSLVAAPATGDRYRDALADNYAIKARFEENQMRDFDSAEFYANKGLRAIRGDEIKPEKPEEWGTWNDEVLRDLKGARLHLMNQLSIGAATKHPIITARAMVSYDCWVEQKDEGFQPRHIANCRNDFLLNMAKLDGLYAVPVATAPNVPAATPKPAPKDKDMTAVLPAKDFLVYFNFDSAEITTEAMGVLHQAAADARQSDTRVFEVIGHTDRVGTAAYNNMLSQKRARAVQQALLDMGFNKFNVIVRAEGETEPAITTGDGVREPRNRRVRLSVLDRRVTS